MQNFPPHSPSDISEQPIIQVKSYLPQHLYNSQYIGCDSLRWFYLTPKDGTEEEGVQHRLVILRYDVTKNDREQFANELILMQTVHSDYILPTFEVGQILYRNQTLPYYIIEDCPQTLQDFMQSNPIWPSQQIFSLLRQLAYGLEALHSVGHIHANLSPCKILFTDDHTPKISGLSIPARRSHFLHSLLNTWIVVPSLAAYLAPEQYTEKPWDERVDVFSLGLIAFELAVGRPFISVKNWPCDEDWNRRYSSLAEIKDRALYQLCSRMLAPYAYRLKDMGEVLNEIDGIQTHIIPNWIEHLVNKMKSYFQFSLYDRKLAIHLNLYRRMFKKISNLFHSLNDPSLTSLLDKTVETIKLLPANHFAPFLASFLYELSLQELQSLAKILVQKEFSEEWLGNFVQSLPVTDSQHPATFLLVGLWLAKANQGEMVVTKTETGFVIEDCPEKARLGTAIQFKLCPAIWDRPTLNEVTLLIHERPLTNISLLTSPSTAAILMVLQEQLNSRSTYVCSLCGKLLAHLGNKSIEVLESLSDIVAAYLHPSAPRFVSAHFRCQAISALADLVDMNPTEILSQIAMPLDENVREFWQPCVHTLCTIYNSGKYPHAIEPVISHILMNDEDNFLHLNENLAIICTQEIVQLNFADPRVEQCVIEGLQHLSSTVRKICMEGLGKAAWGNPSYIDILLHELETQSFSTAKYCLDILQPLISTHPELAQHLLADTHVFTGLAGLIFEALTDYVEQYPEIIDAAIEVFKDANTVMELKRACLKIIAKQINLDPQIPSLLLKGLCLADEQIHITCQHALSQLTHVTKEVAEELLLKLTHIGTDNLLDCAALLSRTGPCIIPKLVYGLQSKDSDARYICAVALQYLNWEPDNLKMQMWSCFALQQWDDLPSFGSQIIMIVKRGIEDARWDFRKKIAEELGTLAVQFSQNIHSTDEDQTYVKQAILALIEGLQNWHRSVREACTRSLIDIGLPAVDLVAPFCHASPPLNQHAVRILQEIRKKTRLE